MRSTPTDQPTSYSTSFQQVLSNRLCTAMYAPSSMFKPDILTGSVGRDIYVCRVPVVSGIGGMGNAGTDTHTTG